MRTFCRRLGWRGSGPPVCCFASGSEDGGSGCDQSVEGRIRCSRVNARRPAESGQTRTLLGRPTAGLAMNIGTAVLTRGAAIILVVYLRVAGCVVVPRVFSSVPHGVAT